MLKRTGLIFLLMLGSAGSILAVEKTEITDRAKEVLDLLHKKNYQKLSEFVSSEKPLCFALFVFDDSIKKCFSKQEVADLPDNSKQIYFGKYEETEFKMAFQQFYDGYLVPAEYLKAEMISFDRSEISLNTTASTPAREILANYPNSHFVEFMMHRKQDASNKSLYMVFQRSGAEWNLSCITQISASEAHYMF